MKFLITVILVSSTFYTVAQKHCKCDAKDIANWKYKEIGKNDDVLKGQPEFQHPVTTFYRNQGSWYNPDKDQNVKLKSIEFYKFDAIAKNEPFTSIKS